jgi:hypothetical protein
MDLDRDGLSVWAERMHLWVGMARMLILLPKRRLRVVIPVVAPYEFAIAKLSAAASTVRARSASEWAVETKSASNCDGGK